MLPTITASADRIRTGRLQPLELVNECLARIERFESQVRAWVLVDADGARAAAKVLGTEVAAGRWRGPLHGIPLGIKDIVDVHGWPTLAGSKVRATVPAAHDATIVRRLRQAGAIFLGKTVTTEFASFDPPPTRNPWNLQRTPGGSSSGSAAAVAMGMCLAAVGSQTGGSITRPASYCGVAGCKPSYGRVSLEGIVPLAPSMDHPGPIARKVADLGCVLRAMLDPESGEQPPGAGSLADLALTLNTDSTPRIGLLVGFFLDEAEAPVRQAVLTAVERLRAAGAEIVEQALPASFADVIRRHRQIMAIEAADYHRDTFAARRADYGPKITALLDEGFGASALDYLAAVRLQTQFRADMQEALASCDALLVPATVSTAPGAETTGDPRFQSPWSFSGLPTVSIPCALADDGLPVALQLVGAYHGEELLLRAAAWCEQRLAFDAVPSLLGS